MLSTSYNRKFGFVACASDIPCLHKYLLASPCLQTKEYYQAIYFNASSAAEAFNAEMDKKPQVEWLVWVHQDVYLPTDWNNVFSEKLTEALIKFPRLAVAGVYGIANFDTPPQRLGHIWDRDRKLIESAQLPALANSLDEMLIAVRTDSGLRFDPDLGFDFYATDLALSAAERGFAAVVVDAYCEHWSSTSRVANHDGLVRRIVASASVFEQKWSARFPLVTPCFPINKIGDVARQCAIIANK